MELMQEKVAIIDVDGTLADTTHRQHFVRYNPKNFDAFYAAMQYDPVIEKTAQTVRDMYANDWTIIIATGRENKTVTDRTNLDVTIDWLEQNDIPFDEIFIREYNDHRPDHVVKRDILEKVRAKHGEPLIVFDDRQQVVDFWRSEGMVVHQVNEHDF